VEFARNHRVRVHVRSSFTWAPGTWVTEEDAMSAVEGMEQAIISGVTHDTGEAKVTIERVPDRPGIAATIFRDLAEAGINVDMIVQNVSSAGHTDISFTVPHADVDRTAQCMDKIVVDIGASGFQTDEHIGRVSLIGAGMKTHPGIAAKMFETLAGDGVNIEMISTSTIRISCVVAEQDVERAVRSLHAAFELEKG
jgi:aspartate kinase